MSMLGTRAMGSQRTQESVSWPPPAEQGRGQAKVEQGTADRLEDRLPRQVVAPDGIAPEGEHLQGIQGELYDQAGIALDQQTQGLAELLHSHIGLGLSP